MDLRKDTMVADASKAIIQLGDLELNTFESDVGEDLTLSSDASIILKAENGRVSLIGNDKVEGIESRKVTFKSDLIVDTNFQIAGSLQISRNQLLSDARRSGDLASKQNGLILEGFFDEGQPGLGRGDVLVADRTLVAESEVSQGKNLECFQIKSTGGVANFGFEFTNGRSNALIEPASNIDIELNASTSDNQLRMFGASFKGSSMNNNGMLFKPASQGSSNTTTLFIKSQSSKPLIQSESGSLYLRSTAAKYGLQTYPSTSSVVLSTVKSVNADADPLLKLEAPRVNVFDGVKEISMAEEESIRTKATQFKFSPHNSTSNSLQISETGADSITLSSQSNDLKLLSFGRSGTSKVFLNNYQFTNTGLITSDGIIKIKPLGGENDLSVRVDHARGESHHMLSASGGKFVLTPPLEYVVKGKTYVIDLGDTEFGNHVLQIRNASTDAEIASPDTYEDGSVAGTKRLVINSSVSAIRFACTVHSGMHTLIGDVPVVNATESEKVLLSTTGANTNLYIESKGNEVNISTAEIGGSGNIDLRFKLDQLTQPDATRPLNFSPFGSEKRLRVSNVLTSDVSQAILSTSTGPLHFVESNVHIGLDDGNTGYLTQSNSNIFSLSSSRPLGLFSGVANKVLITNVDGNSSATSLSTDGGVLKITSASSEVQVGETSQGITFAPGLASSASDVKLYTNTGSSVVPVHLHYGPSIGPYFYFDTNASKYYYPVYLEQVPGSSRIQPDVIAGTKLYTPPDALSGYDNAPGSELMLDELTDVSSLIGRVSIMNTYNETAYTNGALDLNVKSSSGVINVLDNLSANNSSDNYVINALHGLTFDVDGKVVGVEAVNVKDVSGVYKLQSSNLSLQASDLGQFVVCRRSPNLQTGMFGSNVDSVPTNLLPLTNTTKVRGRLDADLDNTVDFSGSVISSKSFIDLHGQLNTRSYARLTHDGEVVTLTNRMLDSFADSAIFLKSAAGVVLVHPAALAESGLTYECVVSDVRFSRSTSELRLNNSSTLNLARFAEGSTYSGAATDQAITIAGAAVLSTSSGNLALNSFGGHADSSVKLVDEVFSISRSDVAPILRNNRSAENGASSEMFLKPGSTSTPLIISSSGVNDLIFKTVNSESLIVTTQEGKDVGLVADRSLITQGKLGVTVKNRAVGLNTLSLAPQHAMDARKLSVNPNEITTIGNTSSLGIYPDSDIAKVGNIQIKPGSADISVNIHNSHASNMSILDSEIEILESVVDGGKGVLQTVSSATDAAKNLKLKSFSGNLLLQKDFELFENRKIQTTSLVNAIIRPHDLANTILFNPSTDGKALYVTPVGGSSVNLITESGSDINLVKGSNSALVVSDLSQSCLLTTSNQQLVINNTPNSTIRIGTGATGTAMFANATLKFMNSSGSGKISQVQDNKDLPLSGENGSDFVKIVSAGLGFTGMTSNVINTRPAYHANVVPYDASELTLRSAHVLVDRNLDVRSHDDASYGQVNFHSVEATLANTFRVEDLVVRVNALGTTDLVADGSGIKVRGWRDIDLNDPANIVSEKSLVYRNVDPSSTQVTDNDGVTRTISSSTNANNTWWEFKNGAMFLSKITPSNVLVSYKIGINENETFNVTKIAGTPVTGAGNQPLPQTIAQFESSGVPGA